MKQLLYSLVIAGAMMVQSVQADMNELMGQINKLALNTNMTERVSGLQDLLQKTSDQEGQLAITLYLGQSYILMGKWDDAAQQYASITNATKFPNYQLPAYENLARCLMAKTGTMAAGVPCRKKASEVEGVSRADKVSALYNYAYTVHMSQGLEAAQPIYYALLSKHGAGINGAIGLAAFKNVDSSQIDDWKGFLKTLLSQQVNTDNAEFLGAVKSAYDLAP